MKDIIFELYTIIKKEVNCFLKSNIAVFVVYGILVFVWSFLPIYNNLGSFAFGNAVWWLFFSVIVSGNFANTVFVAERINGTIEILVTCGFSRTGVLVGKIVFIIMMSLIIGILCFALSLVWIFLLNIQNLFINKFLINYAILYLSGTILNTCAGAWMSIRFSSPRLIPFVNILLIGIVIGLFYAFYFTIGISVWFLSVLLLFFAIIFFFLARKDFLGEKIISPVDI
jgi:ABC-type transport system involved in cytochrome c biogenesis permease component